MEKVIHRCGLREICRKVSSVYEQIMQKIVLKRSLCNISRSFNDVSGYIISIYSKLANNLKNMVDSCFNSLYDSNNPNQQLIIQFILMLKLLPTRWCHCEE